jgi:hypothetical protein
MVVTSTDTTVNPHVTTEFFRQLNMVTLCEALADGTTALKDIRNAKLYFKMQATERIKSSTQTKMDKREVNQWFDMQCYMHKNFILQALQCTTTIGSQAIKTIEVCMMLTEYCWQQVLH